jgi:hypothetical protein
MACNAPLANIARMWLRLNMTSTHYPRHNPLESFGPAIDEQTSLREAFEAAELLGWNVRTKQVFVRDDEPRTESDALIQVDSRR